MGKDNDAEMAGQAGQNQSCEAQSAKPEVGNVNSESAKVGFGRPPKKSRFAPGVSGNPRGRPRNSKNSKTLLEEIGEELCTISEGRRRLIVTKREAVFRAAYRKALAGDLKAAKLVIGPILDPSAQEIEAEIRRKFEEERKAGIAEAWEKLNALFNLNGKPDAGSSESVPEHEQREEVEEP